LGELERNLFICSFEKEGTLKEIDLENIIVGIFLLSILIYPENEYIDYFFLV